jgi:hypothetical protein
MDPLPLATNAVDCLSTHLLTVGEQAPEKIGDTLPEAVGNVWKAITARFTGRPAAEEAVRDLVAKLDDADNQAAFRKELRKILEAEPAFKAEFERLLSSAQSQSADTIINIGSGAVTTKGGVAAGEGGVAVKGDVHGNISLGKSEKK